MQKGRAKMKTAKGLVEYCHAQLGKPYWYGCFGNIATKSLHSTKAKQYPYYYDQSRYKVKYADQYGQRVHDCIGLIKGYLWSDTPTSVPKYNSAQDVSANGMLGKCTKHGKISTLPEVAGVLLFMKGHVGVYIGGGYAIEAKGHDSGVVKTKVAGRGWTDWGFCPWITYESTSTETSASSSGNTASSGVQYFPKYSGTSGSIVDALKAIGVDSSRANRTVIAKNNGISVYMSTAAQNVQLLQLLKAGKLIKP